MLTRLKKFSQLSCSNKKVFVQAWLLFFKFDLLISFIPYSHWRNKLSIANLPNSDSSDDNKFDETQLEPASPQTLMGPETLNDIKHIITLSESAGRSHFRKMNCLRRCLTQQQLLKTNNYITKMHIGVALNNGKLSAHSWLSYKGQVINDTNDVTERYSALKALNEDDIVKSLK